MIFEVKQPDMVESIFEGWQETLIWSCLQNVMGHLYTNNLEHPKSAMALIADFCFFAGEPDEELALYKPESCTQDFIIMVPQNKAWQELLENCYRERIKKVTRYAIKKEEDIFDKEHLENVVNALPSDYTIKMVEEELFLQCREIDWCRDLVSQYVDYEMYQKCGLGVVVLKDEEIVAGASSYTSYLGGIEVEIDTKQEYRRKGFAYASGAKLILECLKRGWYPSWDAQNKWSVALAEKLGYHFDHEYVAYELYDY